MSVYHGWYSCRVREARRWRRRAADGEKLVGEAEADIARLEEELNKRIEMMKTTRDGEATSDQFRGYQEVIAAIESGQYLRMIVQASAGNAST